MKCTFGKRLAGFAAAGALALAMAPMAALGVGAQTADSTLTVSGLDKGDQVSFYRILELDTQEHGGNWKFVSALDADAYGTTGYGTLDGTSITVENLRAGANADAYDDFEVITGDMANQIAAQVASKISTADKTGTATSEGKVVIDLRDGLSDDDPTPVGLYMAVVTSPASTDVVYKPIFVSADYDKDGQDGTIDAYGTYPEHDNTNAIELTEKKEGSTGATDYKDNSGIFKKSKLTLEKEAGTETDRLMDAAVGQVIPFTVTTNMPSYTQNFTAPVFKISDVLTEGLELCSASGGTAAATDITVAVDGYSSLSSPNDYEVTRVAATGWTVEFKADDPSKTDSTKDGILYTVLGNPQVTVTYYAKVTDASKAAQVNQMDNTVRLDFSNSPTDTTGAGTLKDRTRHYTFGIDANVLGSGNTGPDGESTTSEIRKIAVDANGDPIYETTTKTVKDAIEKESPDVYNWLQDATFRLVQKKAWQEADAASGDDTYGTDGKFVDITETEIKFDANNVAGGTNPPKSDAKGYISMKGLDAGVYELTEVSAPLGYTFDPSMKYVITIKPEFADDNEQDPTFTDVPNKILKSYKVSIDVQQNGTSKAVAETTYTSDTDSTGAPMTFIDEEATEGGTTYTNSKGVITTTDTTSETAFIMNKELGILPATGGSGILFYVFIGAGIMAVAVVLARRMRKDPAGPAAV